MEQLLNTDGVTSQHDVRHLYDVIETNVRSLDSLGESYGSLLSSVLMNKLPSKLRLLASRKFGDTDNWEFTAPLKKSKPGNRQPHMLLTRVDDLRNTQLVLCCLLRQPHLNAAFVGKDTHHRIVELSLENSLIGRYSENW